MATEEIKETVIEIKICRSDGSYYSDQYSDRYSKSQVYCPNCGIQGILLEMGGDDYYLGTTGYCLNCKMYHHNANDFYKMDEEFVDRLKSAIEEVNKHGNK